MKAKHLQQMKAMRVQLQDALRISIQWDEEDDDEKPWFDTSPSRYIQHQLEEVMRLASLLIADGVAIPSYFKTMHNVRRTSDIKRTLVQMDRIIEDAEKKYERAQALGKLNEPQIRVLELIEKYPGKTGDEIGRLLSIEPNHLRASIIKKLRDLELIRSSTKGYFPTE